MKYLIVLLFSFLLLSCTSSVTGDSHPEKTARIFTEGLTSENIDLLMSAYHEEAVVVFTAPDGRENREEGKAAIRAGQLKGFRNNPPLRIDFDKRKQSQKGRVYTCELSVWSGDLELINTLEVIQIEGKWGIINQTVIINTE